MNTPSAPPDLARAAARVVLAGTATAAGLVGCSVAVVRGYAAGHLHAEADAPQAPVGLVLGAEVYRDGRPSAFLAGRLDLARRLLAAGRVQVLLLSGDGAAPEYDEPKAMQAYLLAAGVPADRMVLDRHGLDTYDSCFRAARVYGVRRLLVVTQSYHLPRAVGTARALGMDAEGVGDVARRRVSPAWVKGLLRDQLACVKTVLDLATRRQPALGTDPGSSATLLG